jgi:hypothetical protein
MAAQGLRDDMKGERMRGFALAAVALVLAGCASASQPSVAVYPAKGQTAAQQERDSAECQTWAKQQTGYDPAVDTAKGAGVGAVLGAVGGAAAGAAPIAACKQSKPTPLHKELF